MGCVNHLIPTPHSIYRDLRSDCVPAINMALAFCMGPDIQSLINSDQPMAQMFLNSFGQKPTLAIWAIVVIVQ